MMDVNVSSQPSQSEIKEGKKEGEETHSEAWVDFFAFPYVIEKDKKLEIKILYCPERVYIHGDHFFHILFAPETQRCSITRFDGKHFSGGSWEVVFDNHLKVGDWEEIVRGQVNKMILKQFYSEVPKACFMEELIKSWGGQDKDLSSEKSG